MCCCRNHREKNISEGGGGETNVKLKLLGAIYTKRDNSVHVLLHFLSLDCQRGGKKMGGGNPPPPPPTSINETLLVCRVIGNVHTVASVYWCVFGEEYVC